MVDRKHVAAGRASLAVSMLLLSAGPAFAYGGPAGDVQFIGYFLSLLAFLGVCFASVFLWPFYALMGKIRGRKKQPAPDSSPPQNPTQPTDGGGAAG